MIHLKAILGNRILIRREPTRENSVLQRHRYADIHLPPSADDREPHFEAIIVAVGEKLSEDIKPGDRVICGAHQSQNRVGTRKVMWRGEPAELMSVLDVIAIVGG